MYMKGVLLNNVYLIFASYLCLQVAVGNDHVIAVTVERMVYSWGSGSKGQLGHGTLDDKPKPELVEALKGKSIIKYVLSCSPL